MKDIVKKKIKAYQAILYLLNKHGTEDITPEIAVAIENGDANKVREFFNGELGASSLPALRIMAQNLGIFPVYGPTKSELIQLIQERQS